jgi:NAD(P)-dependent dehydrogenase (short-subunit alcohol dehydrogenase family)
MLILITGASKGIGFEVVKQFSAQSGLFIIAVSRDVKSLSAFIQKNNSHSVLPLKADITKAKDLKKIHALIRSLNISLDVLIHNAGSIVNKPFEKISPKELNAVYATNVFGPFLLTQSLLPLFSKKQRSHIVTVGSMGGFQGSSKFAGLSAYSSSKAALSGLTECLAEELKPKNIAVNCLALGAVQTEMLGKAFPGYKAPLKPAQMAEFICHFALTGQNYFNGKILPVSSTNP